MIYRNVTVTCMGPWVCHVLSLAFSWFLFIITGYSALIFLVNVDSSGRHEGGAADEYIFGFIQVKTHYAKGEAAVEDRVDLGDVNP